MLFSNPSLLSSQFEDVKAYYTSATDNAEKKHVLSSIGETPDLKLKMDR